MAEYFVAYIHNAHLLYRALRLIICFGCYVLNAAVSIGLQIAFQRSVLVPFR